MEKKPSHATDPLSGSEMHHHACAVTASINLIWGCKFMSPSTGIIMNNQMDDFAIPGVIRYTATKIPLCR
jgi:gamma-glutamyltranspeptidase